MKTCPSCCLEKDKSEFGVNRRTKDGHSCYCLLCARNKSQRFAKTPEQQEKRKARYLANKTKILQQAKERWGKNKERYGETRDQWMLENRDKMLSYYISKGTAHRAFIDALKKDLPCLDCKQVFSPYVMEYDHVRGSKRFSIGKMANHKRERVLEEISKCELVCCNCHRIRSHNRRKPAKTPKLLEFREWVGQRKSAPCSDCKKRFPHPAMDFDHVKGKKLAQITDMWSWGRKKVLTELAKCELVCGNCHRERTVSQLRQVS